MSLHARTVFLMHISRRKDWVSFFLFPFVFDHPAISRFHRLPVFSISLLLHVVHLSVQAAQRPPPQSSLPLIALLAIFAFSLSCRSPSLPCHSSTPSLPSLSDVFSFFTCPHPLFSSCILVPSPSFSPFSPPTALYSLCLLSSLPLQGKQYVANQYVAC